MSEANSAPPDADRARRLAELEATWEARYRLEPKLPTSALLTGAVAMATGFGTVMFVAFAWATGWPRMFVIHAVVFGVLSLVLGLLNRYFARRWFRSVETWSAERRSLAAELESLRGPASAPRPDSSRPS